MTTTIPRSVFLGLGGAAFCALFAIAGCGSDSTGTKQVTATLDASSGATLDTATPVGSLDAVTLILDGASDASVSGEVASDTLALDFGQATSSLARIVDPQVPDADATTLASDNAAFAFDAYKQLIASHDNLVFSPASISIALAMTYAGAAGTTASEMAQALHFTLPPASLHPAFNALDQALASRGQGYLGADGGPMQVNIVNALWAEQTCAFKADFLATLAANYGAEVNLLDFSNAPDASRLTINAWVAEQTNDKIQDLLPEGTIDGKVKLVLTDAVYFNAAWATPFDPSNSYNSSFTLLDNTLVTTRMMNAESISIPAAQGTNYRAVSLPYADNRLSLVVVVPDAGQFSQVEASLDATSLATMVNGMTTKRVGLTLPSFRIETGSISLVQLLKALGMNAAFNNATADFSGMTGSSGLYISNVLHKAFIDVAEKGTEAAAATAVVMKDASAPMVDLYVSAVRPFLYFLRDQPTGAILFMGRVLDPTKN